MSTTEKPSFLRAFLRAFGFPILATGVSSLLALGLSRLPVAPRFASIHDLAVRGAQTLVWLSAITVSVAFGRFVLYERLILRLARFKAPKLVDQAGATFAYVVGGALMLNYTWGVSVSSMLATSGVVGLVLGFALKNVLADYLSGIALNLEVPFRLKDFVLLRIRGQGTPIVGLVREVSWRSTTVITPEQKLVLVPNSVVAEATIENGSAPSSITEFELEIALDFGVPSDVLESVLVAAVTQAWMDGATDGDAPPKVRIRRLDGSGVVYKITYEIDPLRISKGRARHLLLRAVHDHLRAADLRPVNVRVPAAQRAPDYDRLEDRIARIGAVRLFGALTAEERAHFAARVHVRRPRANDVVVRAGEDGSSMFLVAAGVLEVKVARSGAALPVRVATLAPGEIFGEMSALTGVARTATVIAAVPCVLYEIPHDAFTELLATRPALVDSLSTVIADRRREASEAATERGSRPEIRSESVAENIANAIREFFSA